ncbi:hypothetical protein BCR32DRAFT_267577 [Anaeromyces robustus]|uniref:MARVEL domain-containing protein n=1 Tax=Anaeromyces robustus TaxID=1754192 RepID=A0A1Y1XA01_9FUNG|nr:hypothetical protein BCR32DRAFT_267577 [Anaeromyces robustus]|eukprot:ORX82568.1 hypothetical protein BCR32DRAFT_267577 [Anaeromyces robustus]
MGFFEALLHPTSFLGLTDLRIGTIILAVINFILILPNVGGGGETFQYIIFAVITVLALICTFLGAWGAFKNNSSHVTYYYYYCFFNVIIAIYNCVMAILSVSIWLIVVNIVYLIIAVYTLSIVKGYLGNVGGSGAAGAV